MYHPNAVALENLVKTNQNVPWSDKTDAEWLVDELESMGYTATKVILQAGKYGSLTRRQRQWWIAIDGIGRYGDLCSMERIISACELSDDDAPSWQSFCLPEEQLLRPCKDANLHIGVDYEYKEHHTV